MKYLIAIAILLYSCVVLILTMKEYKKICIGLILLIILAFGSYLGIKYFVIGPKIHIIGAQHVIVEVGTEYKEQGATATYRFSDLTELIEMMSNVNTKEIGRYDIYYKIEADNKQVSAKRTVDVVDYTPPTIALNGSKNVTISSMDLFEETGFEANDNYDGNLTEKVVVETNQISEEEYEKVYYVKDSSGNICKEKRKIIIKDIIPPEIILDGNFVENMYIGGTYEESGVTAKDDLDGDLTNQISVTSDIDTSKLGKYTVTYTVKDKSGNVGKNYRRVEVVQRPDPQGAVYLTFDDGPSESTTPYILDILKEENVKATFFILNYNDNTEYLVKRIVDEGHAIGLHGYSHEYSYIYQSEETYMENLSKLRNKIKESTGTDTIITRFPGGSSNTISNYNPGIMTRLTKKVIEEGYRYFDWNSNGC